MITITSMVNNMNGFFALKQSEETLSKASKNLTSFDTFTKAQNNLSELALAQANSNIRNKNQSIVNTNDAISLNQIASSAIDSASEILHRIKELAIEADDNTLTDEETEIIQAEVTQLTSELSDIGKKTTFNGINVFDNSQSLTIQVGFNNAVSLDLSELTSAGDNSTTGNSDLMKGIDNALAQINETQSKLAANQTTFSAAIENLSSIMQQTEQSHTQINDAQSARSIAQFINEKLTEQNASSNFLKHHDSDKAFISSLLSGQ